jgi:hypothetical protein
MIEGKLLLLGVDDVDESRLERGTTNEETVNVGLAAEVAAVLLVDAAAVQDAGSVSNAVADVLLEPLADGLVDLLGLLGGGNLAGANGPDGLVGNDNLAPVRDLLLEGRKLGADDVDGLAGLALLEGLAAAPDDADAVLGGVLGLGGNVGVGLGEDSAALRVAEDGPCDVTVLELGDRDLAGEGAVGLVEDVLGGDLDLGAEVLAGKEEVERGGSDDDLDVGIDGGLVQVVDNLLDGRDRPVPGSSCISIFTFLCPAKGS